MCPSQLVPVVRAPVVPRLLWLDSRSLVVPVAMLPSKLALAVLVVLCVWRPAPAKQVLAAMCRSLAVAVRRVFLARSVSTLRMLHQVVVR